MSGREDGREGGEAAGRTGLARAVYRTIRLRIALAMNWYNARAKLVER